MSLRLAKPSLTRCDKSSLEISLIKASTELKIFALKLSSNTKFSLIVLSIAPVSDQYVAINPNWCAGKHQTIVGGNTNAKVISSTNPIRVVAGQTYTLENFDFSNIGSGFYVKEYASLEAVESDTYIEHITTLSSKQFTLLPTTQYVKLQVNFTVDTTPTSANVGKIAFHLTWDESRTGFEEYEKHIYPLPNVVLRSAGSAYDSVLPSGLLTRRIGVVDLGSLDGWSNYGTGLDTERVVSSALSSLIKSTPATVAGNLLSKFEAIKYNDLYGSYKNGIALDGTSLYIKDSSIIGLTTNEQIKSALSGVYLFYELAEPTTEQVEAFEENVEVDDFGTTEFNSTYPQGNDFFYYVDYKAFVDSVGNREDIGFDASKIVSQTQLQQAMGGIDLSAYPQKASDETITGKWVFPIGTKIKINDSYYYEFTDDNFGQIGFKRNGQYGITMDGYTVRNLEGANPRTNNAYSIGTSSLRWQNVYTESIDSSSTFTIKINGVGKFAFTSWNILPYEHQDLGSASYPFKDAFINGKLTDGTNEVSIADLKALIDYAKQQGWIS